jgi:hypothetical protein
METLHLDCGRKRILDLANRVNVAFDGAFYMCSEKVIKLMFVMDKPTPQKLDQI